MSLQKALKKLLSVTLVVALVSQQSGLAFATTNVSNWSDLRSGISSYADDYYVTQTLTASAYPNGTLYVGDNGRSIWGAALYQNSTNDTLISVGSGVSFGVGNNLYGSIYNNGTLNFSGNSLTNGSVTGSGTLNLYSTSLVNNNAITQNYVSIGSSASVDNNALLTASITNAGTLYSTATNLGGNVSNSNTLNLEGGTLSVDVTGSSNGTTNITGNLMNEGSLSQYDINISSGKLVTTSADDLTASHIITNDGNINYTTGSTANTIRGNGRIIVTGYVTNTGDIDQNIVDNSSVLVNNGNGTSTGIINANLMNSGSLEGTGSFITKTGTSSNSGVIEQTNLTNNGTFTNNGHITLANTFTNSSTGVLNTDASLISAANGMLNAGTVNFMTGTNAVNMTGTGTTNFHNTTGNTATITQNLVTNDGKLNNAGTITANLTNTNEITGTGSIVTKNGTSTNNGTITQSSLTNNGTFNNNGKMNLTNSLAALTNNATFNNSADLTGSVSNAGTLTNIADIVGSVDNTGTIDNDGSITGNVTNAGTIDNDGLITGAIINSGTIDSTADNLAGTIKNTNTLNIAGGTIQGNITDDTTPTGEMNITADLINGKSITQATVNNSAVLTNSGAITADISNSGTIHNSAVITGAIINSGTINSTADNLVGTIKNTNTLNIAGGTIQGNITDDTTPTGEMNITADLINGKSITQATVNNAAVLTNSGSINATDIVNNGTIIGKAEDLAATNGIVNNGVLVFDAPSTGTSNISGTGSVQVTAATTLSGTNTYTNGTLIDGATLTVADASTNIGTGNISFDTNAILDITGTGTLSHSLVGVDAADNIRLQNDADLTFAGTIGTANDFYKLGSGTLTLSMDSNSYTGITHIDGGKLVGKTTQINNNVVGASGTIVEFTDTADATLNTINTAGTFIQNGTAVLNVTNAFSANQVDINAGTFAANRALTATTLNVKNSGTLRGNGNITGTVNVNSGATLAPGNSIDTLTVNGNLNLASGSTTAIEINETTSDKIVVTGTTNITSGANLTVANEGGRFFEWESFDLLESGNINGTFTYDNTISNFDTDRIDVALDYSDPTKVTLTAKRKATDYENTSTVALPRNANEAARAIDAISTGFGGDITNALLQLEALGGLNPDGITVIDPQASLVSALTDITGVLYANSALMPFFNAKTTQVYDRVDQRTTQSHANNVWLQYYHQYDKVFASENSPRFTNNMTGAVVGYDHLLGDFVVGSYVGFGKSDLRQRHGSAMDVDDTTFGAYGGYTTGDWAFKGTLFGGVQDYYGKRYIAFMGRTANGRYDGMNVGIDLEAAYNIPVYSWLNVKPFAGWLNNYAYQHGFAETNADALNLHVNSNDQFTSQARLGVRVDGQIKNKFNWYGSVAVKQIVGDDYAKLNMYLDMPNTDMKVVSAEIGKTSFSGQVGANYAFTDNWSVFANINAGINNKSANCYGNLGVSYTW